MCGYGTDGHGLCSGLVVLGEWLGLMILKVFSKPNELVILSWVDLQVKGLKENASHCSFRYIFFHLLSIGRCNSNECGLIRPHCRSILTCFLSPPSTPQWSHRQGKKELAELCPSCHAACWDTLS